MINVYASTNRIAELPAAIKRVYEEDMWKIVEMSQTAGTLNIEMMDNVVKYYCLDSRLDKVEGLVLPVFEQNGIAVGQFTVEHMMTCLLNSNRP